MTDLAFYWPLRLFFKGRIDCPKWDTLSPPGQSLLRGIGCAGESVVSFKHSQYIHFSSKINQQQSIRQDLKKSTKIKYSRSEWGRYFYLATKDCTFKNRETKEERNDI